MSQRMAVAVFVLLIALILVFVALVTPSAGNERTAELRITFLDVGQGDATLIESPSGTQVLIDGGPDASVLRELGEVLGFFDRGIDLIVATHPDQDHIAGLVDVLDRYQVAAILMTENESDTPVYGALKERIEEEGGMVYLARAGQVYDLGSGPSGSTTLTILFPDRDPSGLESNVSSIVAQLRYGETEFMFTGDSPESIETYLVTQYGSALESEVLKVGHHGSRTSSSLMFLDMVGPAYALVSAGKDNRYGHPHKEVVDRLAEFNIETKNTAELGSIVCVSDGTSVGCN